MVNASLSLGRLPASQKQSVITPLLKKPNLDPGCMANYRPISNLSFLSKVIERIVFRQVNQHLTACGLLPRFQSAYRRFHSTETALLRVLSDVFASADKRQVTLLALLDLTAAFDCVDHQILFNRLKLNMGLSDQVLNWFTSFLTDRTQRVSFAGLLSTVRSVIFGVPQGSVLGPLLFILYIAELDGIITAHNLRGHFYADDSQIYLSSAASDAMHSVERLTQCIAEIDEWLRINRLKLNPAKTEMIWLGTRQQVDRINVSNIVIQSQQVARSETVRDLGFIIDDRLTMSAHVTATVRAGFYQLRQLRTVIGSLTSAAAATLVHAFISSRLDYCNSLLHGVADNQIRRLQSVQNAAARLVTGTRRNEHITPILNSLHWLPVKWRIEYKIAMLVYKCLHGLAPTYLADDCQLVASSRRSLSLRSDDTAVLTVPRTRTAIGDRSFAVAGPAIWNGLPLSLRTSSLTVQTFAKLLKTHFFVRAAAAHL